MLTVWCWLLNWAKCTDDALFTVLANNICPPVLGVKNTTCYVTKLFNIDTIGSTVIFYFFSEIQHIVADI